MSKISVLMSVYSKEKSNYLELALESVILNQTLEANEVVLIEDGPLTNELYEVIDKFKNKFGDRFKVYSLEKNMGLGEALKFGVLQCKNEIIARMDTDDISLNDRFEKQLRILKANKHIAVVGSNMFEFSDSISNIKSIKKVPEQNRDIIRYSKVRNPMNHPTTMFRKSAILSVGNYESQLLYEDYLLWLKLLQKGYELYNIQEELLYFRANKDAYKRRGGLSRVLKDFHFQNKMFYEYNWTNIFEYIQNILIKTSIILIPNKIREIIYTKYLRKSVK